MIIKNEELKALLLEKKDLFDKGIKLTEDIEKLDAERNTVAMLSQKIKDKMMPIVDKEIKPNLKEFDVLDSIRLTNDDEVEVVIIDAIEEFKKNFKEFNSSKEAPKETENK